MLLPIKMNIKSLVDKQIFAEILGFYQQFGEIVKLEIPDFEQLHDWLLDIGSDVAPGLIEVHKALLIKNKLYLHKTCGDWELLVKSLCSTKFPKGADELETSRGYKYLKLTSRLEILRALQDSLFDRSGSLANFVLSSTEDLNVQYLGVNRSGNRYLMYCSPQEQKFSIYYESRGKEHLVATSRQEILTLISYLSKRIYNERQLRSFLNVLAYAYFN